MKNKVYIVTAYRFGDRQLHSYVVGVFHKKKRSIDVAKQEESTRGGKYACEVLECDYDAVEGEDGYEAKVIFKLRRTLDT